MLKFFKLFCALIVIAGCSQEGNLTIKTQKGDVTYNIEEAQNPQDLEKGLMFRENLAANSGMIFDLSHVSNQVAMWMKNTKIPLDMLFVNANGKIFFIYENATPMSEELIIAPEPAMFVIELNAGDVKKHGIQVGDFIKHHFLDDYNKEVYLDEGKLPPRVETPDSEKAEVNSLAENEPQKVEENNDVVFVEEVPNESVAEPSSTTSEEVVLEEVVSSEEAEAKPSEDDNTENKTTDEKSEVVAQ